MSIGERIRYFRNLRGMTQKVLGELMGFNKNTADMRIAQYENGRRTPKEDMIKEFSEWLKVAPEALKTPDIDSYIGVMHTLFALEDLYGLEVTEKDGVAAIELNCYHSSYWTMAKLLREWLNEYQKLKNGEITEEQYNHWRYTYPRMIKTERIPTYLDDD